MGKIREINTKNQNYFYNDKIDLKNFDAKLLKIDKKRLQRHRHLLYWLCYC